MKVYFNIVFVSVRLSGYLPAFLYQNVGTTVRKSQLKMNCCKKNTHCVCVNGTEWAYPSQFLLFVFLSLIGLDEVPQNVPLTSQNTFCPGCGDGFSSSPSSGSFPRNILKPLPFPSVKNLFDGQYESCLTFKIKKYIFTFWGAVFMTRSQMYAHTVVSP